MRRHRFNRRPPRPRRPVVARPVEILESSEFYALTEQYPTERSAEIYFTDKRWPDGPHCTKCGSGDVYDSRNSRKHVYWKCRDCAKQFTVTSGTVMEGTHIPLRKWLFAFHLMGGARHGLSARYLARQLGLTVKSAWHMAHRIRATMKNDGQQFEDGIVETDETYIGGRRRGRGRGYRGNKIAVQTIVERTGSHRRGGRKHIYDEPGQAQTIALNPEAENVDGRTVGAKLRKHTDPPSTHLMTDESPIYDRVGEEFKSHSTVHHAKGEYARTDPFTGQLISTNTAEGLFANLKRQITGTHHSTSKKHLPRYLEEYDHKYNNRDKTDKEIAEAAIGNMEGKRVTLFKRKSGEGDSLIDTAQGEKRKHGTQRGSSKHERTGKKAEPPPAPPSPSEVLRADYVPRESEEKK